MTKIIATISINSYTADKIEEIILAGADILRFNFSHGTPKEMQAKVQVAKDVINKLKLNNKVKILADLPGAKIRLGDFPDEAYISVGDKILFKTAKSSPDFKKFIPVDYTNIGKAVCKKQTISVGDGEIGFEVIDIKSDDEFIARVLNDGRIPPLKAINLGAEMTRINHITQKTIEHIENLSSIDPDFVAFSFINSGDDLSILANMLRKHRPSFKGGIVAKIETEEAVNNLNTILQSTDFVMIARGDLALSADYTKLGILQDKIISKCKKNNTPFIIATQVMDSILDRFVPARAEIVDVSNAVINGAYAIMLAKETGVSKTPGFSVETVRKIIEETKKIYRI